MSPPGILQPAKGLLAETGTALIGGPGPGNDGSPRMPRSPAPPMPSFPRPTRRKANAVIRDIVRLPALAFPTLPGRPSSPDAQTVVPTPFPHCRSLTPTVPCAAAPRRRTWRLGQPRVRMAGGEFPAPWQLRPAVAIEAPLPAGEAPNRAGTGLGLVRLAAQAPVASFTTRATPNSGPWIPQWQSGGVRRWCC